MCPNVKLTPQIIAEPPGKHSAKPEEMQDRIELCIPRPRRLNCLPGVYALGGFVSATKSPDVTFGTTCDSCSVGMTNHEPPYPNKS